MEKKLLIAFDDSEFSMRAVETVADSFTNDYLVTILSIIPDTAAVCSMYSPELTPHFMAEQGVFCAMEDKSKDLLQSAQEKARKLLIEKGFKEENIVLKLERTRKGVARDIIEEAMSGYTIIAMGRRGLSGIKEFFLGSVSQKVVNSVKNMSILVVD